nr:2-dehydro-3-deoxy-6-phosphogalactonate aldolase [uncultured bacterium]
MSARELLRTYLDQCPLIAIIRGVRPEEAEAIGDAIYEGGIRIIEIPLNSPDPLRSIGLLARRFGERTLGWGGDRAQRQGRAARKGYRWPDHRLARYRTRRSYRRPQQPG